MKTKSYLHKRYRAVRVAFSGLGKAFKQEAHLQIHLAAGIVAAGLSLWLGISEQHWLMVLLCIVLVICSELFNSAIEKLCDKVQPAEDPLIGYIKDISAAAVLLCCLFSIVCGLIIFIPPLLFKMSS